MDETPATTADTRGHQLLREYLKRTGTTVYALCQRTGLDRINTQRIVAGERGTRMPVTLAVEIEAATDGYVPVTSWAHSPVDPNTVADDAPSYADAPAAVSTGPTVATDAAQESTDVRGAA